jgi:hypothetical protein
VIASRLTLTALGPMPESTGDDINTIRAWLRHVSVNTAKVYAEVDLELADMPEPAFQIGGPTFTKPANSIAESRISQRVASIGWMRGLVMIFMVIDRASMAFDAHHLDHDSAMYAAGTMVLPAEFFTRWLTHLCAPAFVFLMGTSLALSVERRVVKGVNAWEIDKSMLKRA